MGEPLMATSNHRVRATLGHPVRRFVPTAFLTDRVRKGTVLWPIES